MAGYHVICTAAVISNMSWLGRSGGAPLVGLLWGHRITHGNSPVVGLELATHLECLA
jgi:hypothetical protein